MVHNLCTRQLTANQLMLLEKDAGFNNTDVKTFDFIGAVEPIVHYLNISGF